MSVDQPFHGVRPGAPAESDPDAETKLETVRAAMFREVLALERHGPGELLGDPHVPFLGSLVEAAGRDPIEVTREVEAWIEGQMRRLNPERHGEA